jgi:hypothetical protein
LLRGSLEEVEYEKKGPRRERFISAYVKGRMSIGTCKKIDFQPTDIAGQIWAM